MNFETTSTHAWLEALDEEDLAFIRRFVLSSGSLKKMASVYGVSYPTVRLRLDRLITKIEVLENARTASSFERKLRALYADGRIDLEAMKQLMQAYEQEADHV